MTSEYGLKPYRVEHRRTMTGQWMLVEACETHEEAMARADLICDEFDGYARVISQHVIHRTKGGSRAER